MFAWLGCDIGSFRCGASDGILSAKHPDERLHEPEAPRSSHDNATARRHVRSTAPETAGMVAGSGFVHFPWAASDPMPNVKRL